LTKKIDRKEVSWGGDQEVLVAYMLSQLKEPYESTKSFFSFLNSIEDLNGSSIIDACCGGGSNLFFLRKNFNCGKLVGFDFQDDFLAIASSHAKKLNVPDINFVNADIYNLPSTILNDKFDGAICLQTLSWLDDWRKALEQLAKINTKWMAFSSLFYDGLLESKTEVISYDKDQKIKHSAPYNVYSIPIVKEFLSMLGFIDVVFKPFEIKIDIPRGDLNKIQTFTEKLEDGRRVQFSGPIVLPWYFLFARRQIP